MTDLNPPGKDFLSQIVSIVEANISNEQFGVSELADAMNMSRSNLLRRIKKLTNLSVSQFIRQIRLKWGMELLQNSSMNVSEVAYQTGFSDVSYFIKCFREYYGYPPGDVGKGDNTEEGTVTEIVLEEKTIEPGKSYHLKYIITALVLIIVLAAGFYINSRLSFSKMADIEKSIAVLPFKNESTDSSNVYFINGLMESTLNNLQKVGGLKVISRTSSEKYRNTSLSVPEIARELNVNYLVEGSGQKVGEKILLHIQLIEASTDNHLWAKQYQGDIKDIFKLQEEVAKNIAEEIQVAMTPEEEKRIEKIPTKNLEAYDWFLKGRDFFYYDEGEDLQKGLSYFNKAIELDNKFALAYANAAMVYFYMDMYQEEKKYKLELDGYAKKSFKLDPGLPESLIARGLNHIYKKEHDSAVYYMQKALEFNPNSGLTLHFLSELYHIHIPNTAKYLEYALQKVQLDIAGKDSIAASIDYLQLSNALIQAGFINEAFTYVNKSLDYNSENRYAGYLKAFILLARDKDLKKTKNLLIKEYEKDTLRLDILQDVAKIHYLMRDYEGANKYYQKFMQVRETMQVDIYKHENLKIAITLDKIGQTERVPELINSYKQGLDEDQSIYRDLGFAAYYCWEGAHQKAIAHFKLFSKEDNFWYWVLLLELDPVIDPIKHSPEYQEVFGDISQKFWDTHKKLRANLEGKGLI